jgi:hypothetical protein
VSGRWVTGGIVTAVLLVGAGVMVMVRPHAVATSHAHLLSVSTTPFSYLSVTRRVIGVSSANPCFRPPTAGPDFWELLLNSGTQVQGRVAWSDDAVGAEQCVGVRPHDPSALPPPRP